jgi:hypothetical protein
MAFANCGTIDVFDSCGFMQTINCGTCTGPETCVANVCQLCEDTRTDEEVCDGAECGTVEDICEVERACGTCGPETCNDKIGQCYPPMTYCPGGKYDPSSGLCWQDPASTDRINWFVGAGVYSPGYNPTIQDHCAALGSGWRIPTISELRTLVRNGDDDACYTLEWDMSWASVPDGYCSIWDDCMSWSDCWNDACNPDGCGYEDGPGVGGMYWPAALSSGCDDTGSFWSASERTDDIFMALGLSFSYGRVVVSSKETGFCVRCVRSGP